MKDYTSIPDHMREGLERYVDDGIPGGSFLMSVLENDFLGVITKADSINKVFFYKWAMVLANEIPVMCWGSRERVDSWIELGGENGIRARKEANSQAD